MSTRKKHICNIVSDLTSGGVESIIINNFSLIDKSNYQLDLLTYAISSKMCADKFRKLGFNIIEIPPKRKGFIKSFLVMDKVIREGHYDVVHSHLTEWNCMPMFISWKHKVKIRVSHSHMANFSKHFLQNLLLRVQRFINNHFATKFCACGDDAAIYLYGESWFQKGKVMIINNAIEVNRFDPNAKVRDEVRRELNMNDQTFCVGHIGRFLAQKNHTFLIDVFAQVHNRIPDSCLLLLGIGDLESQIRKKVELLQLSDFVKFLGVRGDPERIYQAMDVFCLPSLFEGFPVVSLEAQAAGIPCLISDTVSNKVKITALIEMMSLSESASIWADKLYLLKSKHLTIKFPNEFSIENTAKLWVELYE